MDDDVPDGDDVVLAIADPEIVEKASPDWDRDANWEDPLPTATTAAFFWCFFMQNVEQ